MCKWSNLAAVQINEPLLILFLKQNLNTPGFWAEISQTIQDLSKTQYLYMLHSSELKETALMTLLYLHYFIINV